MEIKQNKRKAEYWNKKISKELIDKILNDIQRWSTKRHACLSNGISQPCFYYWIKQGIDDLDHGQDETLHAYLVKRLHRIDQEKIINCMEAIRFSPKSHSGAQWILERYYWVDFGDQAKIDHFQREIDDLKESLTRKED